MATTPAPNTNVLFIWKVDIALRDHISNALSDLPVNLVFPGSGEEADYIEYAEQADGIVGWKPSAALLEKAQRLKLFINPGAGVQHLIGPFQEINHRQNIVLVNGHGNAFFTAEHIAAMLLTVTNRLVPHHQWMLEGKWRLGDKVARSISLRNRTIGLLGYGHVNRQVHQFLEPFCPSIKICRKHPEEQHEYGGQTIRAGIACRLLAPLGRYRGPRREATGCRPAYQ